MNTTYFVEGTLGHLFPVLLRLTNYKVATLPSLRKTIDQFSPTDTYDEVLNFFSEKSSEIDSLGESIKNSRNDWMDISYRLKTEQSFVQKWNKNLGKSKQLREVCNDLVGIRVIVDLPVNELKAAILRAVKTVTFKIDIIDMYEKTRR